MHQIQVTHTFPFADSTVWNLLDDYSNTWVYHPIVGHSQSVNGIDRGLGAQRSCAMYNGNSIEERVVEHDALEKRYKIAVVDHGPFPTTMMEVEIKVEAIDESTSRAIIDVDFKLKFGPVGWLMGKMMMERNLAKMLGQMLQGAQDHLETGRVVGEDGILGKPLDQHQRAA